MSENIPKSQRVLVFQGEGALGGYEAAVFKELYKKLREEDKQIGKSRPLFDIVAGTSMGAINAAIIVSHVIEKGTWEGSVEKLDSFWRHITGSSIADRVAPAIEKIPGYIEWWNYWRKIYPKLPSTEEARKYYSAKEFLTVGLQNVFSAPVPVFDTKFFDLQNVWYRYDNGPLKRSIEEFVKFPISTSLDKGEPRLLVIGVDVEEGEKVTFDSYSKYSKYAYDEKSKQYRHVINYDQGLMVEHIAASASIPIHFDYTWVPKQYDYSKEVKDHSLSDSRAFWEGSILSNTPLREVISEHKTFWEKRIGSEKLYREYLVKDGKEKIPNLEVYIVNTWPARTKEVPLDREGMLTRRNDIIFHDKTAYDEKVAVLVTDYVDLVNGIKNIAINYVDKNKKDAFEAEIHNFLTNRAKSKSRMGEQRIYQDLISPRFGMEKVVRIEFRGDE
jgi:NTE family protein